MKRITTILICICSFGFFQSQAQSSSTIDSFNLKVEEKRRDDSTQESLRKIEIEKKRDSMALAIEKRREDRLQRQDSIRSVRQKQRAHELEKKREFLNRKKERAHIRDSLKLESERASSARKAYIKSQKKKEKKETADKTTKVEYQKEVVKPDERKEVEKKEKLAVDSKSNSTKKEDYTIAKEDGRESILVTKNVFSGTNSIRTDFFRDPPTKKTTYFSFQFGSSNYLGDLGGNSQLENNLLGDVNFKANTFFYGFSLTHLRREVIGLRLSYVFGSIAGSDKNTYFKSADDPSYAKYIRNLDFKSKISEGSLMLELHPLKLFSYRRKLHNSYFQPYFLVGIGSYRFNPQGSYYDQILDEDVWVDLQPLSLEGQGMAEFPDRQPYKLTQWNVPYGFGFNYEISPSIQLGLEYVGRKLFTDYLDDVSTSFVDPNLFDTYLTPENAAIARNVNNKSRLIDASKAYKVGDARGTSNNNDLYFSVSARMIIKLNKNKVNNKKKTNFFYRYDDFEICD